MLVPHRRRRALAAAVAAVATALTAACHADTPVAVPPAGGAEQVSIGDIRWYVDYDAAVAVARQLDAPLWVHFGEDPG